MHVSQRIHAETAEVFIIDRGEMTGAQSKNTTEKEMN